MYNNYFIRILYFHVKRAVFILSAIFSTILLRSGTVCKEARIIGKRCKTYCCCYLILNINLRSGLLFPCKEERNRGDFQAKIHGMTVNFCYNIHVLDPEGEKIAGARPKVKAHFSPFFSWLLNLRPGQTSNFAGVELNWVKSVYDKFNVWLTLLV